MERYKPLFEDKESRIKLYRSLRNKSSHSLLDFGRTIGLHMGKDTEDNMIRQIMTYVYGEEWHESLKEDLLPGGKGDNTTDVDFDPKEIEMGMEVESEHTPDPEIQNEIVHDHLDEDPEYYTKLKYAGLADELEEKFDYRKL